MKPSPKLLHAAIARSSLTRAQKAVARFVCRIPSDRISYGLGTVAERLDITERTVRSAVRELERLGVLTLVHRERNGTMPRVYSISRDAIMSIPCAEHDPQGGKKEAQRAEIFPGFRIWRKFSALNFRVLLLPRWWLFDALQNSHPAR